MSHYIRTREEIKQLAKAANELRNVVENLGLTVSFRMDKDGTMEFLTYREKKHLIDLFTDKPSKRYFEYDTYLTQFNDFKQDNVIFVTQDRYKPK